jgi:hypothetical protein
MMQHEASTTLSERRRAEKRRQIRLAAAILTAMLVGLALLTFAHFYLFD